MKRERGSVMIFVLVILAGIAMVLLTTASLTSGALTAQQRREAEMVTRHAFEGVMVRARSDIAAQSSYGPTLYYGNLGDVYCRVQISDNAFDNPHTWQGTGTMTYKGRNYTYTAVVPKRLRLGPNNAFGPNPFTYAIFSRTSIDLKGHTLTTGTDGENGDIGSNGSIRLSAGSRIEGNVEANEGIVTNSATVTGQTLPGEDDIAFPPNPNSLLYYIYRDRTIPQSDIKNPNLGNRELWYCNGNLSVEGNVSGTGTIFVTGNLILDHHLRYANANARVAYIVLGNIILQSSDAKDLDGYFFCLGNFESKGAGQPRTLRNGAIVANSFTIEAPFTATNDPTIWRTPSLANYLRLPGYWNGD